MEEKVSQWMGFCGHDDHVCYFYIVCVMRIGNIIYFITKL